jgi:glycosyltransferase involved in cell wall biosynthesis
MRIAFYAPMKPPTHPVPSGDRRIGRLLLAALRRAGHKVRLASRFRAYEGKGDLAAQRRLRRRGEVIALRLGGQLRRWRPHLWFTYHLHHKAPDWLGPEIAARLRIPYVVAEAAYSPRRSAGRWPDGLEAVASAIGKAAAVVSLNPVDRACVAPLMRRSARRMLIDPFLEARPLGAAHARRAEHRRRLARARAIPLRPPWLLAVAMMRAGDKLASYRLLAKALARIRHRPWQLLIVGDGPARREVRALFRPLGERVHFLGLLGERGLPAVYAAADLFVWPAMNEAIGQAILEAQAAGLAVVAGNAGAVGRIVACGRTGLLVRAGDAAAFARAVSLLLDDEALRRRMGGAAARKAARRHDVGAAANALDRLLGALVRRGAR